MPELDYSGLVADREGMAEGGDLDFSSLQPASSEGKPLDFSSLKPLDYSGLKPVDEKAAPRDAGLLGALPAGAARSVRETAQTAEVAGGAKPEPLPEENILAAQPVGWGDVLHPKALAEKTLYGLGHSAPSFAAGIAGAAAGSALTGPGLGTLVGGALGAGAGAMAQSIGPRFAEELHAHPDDPDGAFNRAIGKASIEAGASGLAWGMFGIAPFKSTVKNLMFQAFGVQPAVSAGARATENIAEGKPIGEGVAEAIPGAITSTLVPVAGHAAARRLLGRGEVSQETPETAATGEPPAPGSVVGYQFGDQPPMRLTVKGYEDNGRGVRVVGEDGGERLMTTADFAKGLTEPPLPERPQLEGEPATLKDLQKNAPPPLEDMEASPTTAIQARAAGQRPGQFDKIQREAQAKAANPLLDEAAAQALSVADREEAAGFAALEAGKTDEAQISFRVAERLRQKYGAQPGEIATPADLATAAAAREAAARPEIMGQRVPGRVEPNLSPEEIATQEQMASLAREEAAKAGAPPPPDLVSGVPPAPPRAPLTPEDEATAAQIREGMRAAAMRQAAPPAQATFGESLAGEMMTRPPEAPPLAPEQPTGFTTAQGSTYEITPEGQTVRTKRSSGRGQGTTYEPHNVLYVAPEVADKLIGTSVSDERIAPGYALNGSFTPFGADVAQIPEGATPAVMRQIKDTGQVIGVYPASATPEVGLHPVEKRFDTEAGTSSTHIGNRIVEIRRAPEPVQAPIPEPAPEPLPAPLLTPSAALPANTVRGRVEPAFVPSTGREFPVEYAVVDAHDLVTSHHDDLSPNTAYPQSLQPRQRERAESEAQIRSILNGGAEGEFRPALLGETPDAANGAPVVGPEGLVEGGNARTMALRRAYDQGLPQAQTYRRWLEDQGYPTQGIENPVLVRVNRSGLDMTGREQLARDLNVPAQAAMSASEQAMADAQQIRPDILRLYSGGSLFSAGNTPLVKAVLSSVASVRDLPALTDPDGGLSTAGRQRVQNALLAKAYGDSGLVAALTEDADSNIKSIGNALIDAAPAWAQLRNAVADGSVPVEYDLTSPLLSAARLIAHARDTRRNVAEFVTQRGLFGEGVTPETEGVLSWMLGAPDWTRRYGRDKIADAIRAYSENARVNTVTAKPSPLELTGLSREQGQGAIRELFAPQMGLAGGAGEVRPEPRAGGPEAQGPGNVEARVAAPEGGERPAGARPGEHVDTLGEYQALTADLDRLGLSYEPEHAGYQVRNYLLSRGYETGNEYYAIQDRNGDVIAAGTTNQPNSVIFDIPSDILADPNAGLTLNHNHITGQSLSRSDVSVLGHQGAEWVAAHTDDYDTFAARLTPEARGGVAAGYHEGIQSAYDAAYDIVVPSMKMQARSGKIGWEDGEMLSGDLVMRSLDAAGIVDYVSTRGPLPLSEAVRNSILQRASKAARNAATDDGLVSGPRSAADYTDRINRSAIGVRPDDAFAALSGRLDEQLASRAASESASAERAPREIPTPEGGPQVVVAGGPPRRLAEEPLIPERPAQPAPAGTDYIDNVTDQIGRETGGKGPGTYARDLLKGTAEQAARSPFRFNLLNGFGGGLIFPMTQGRVDWRSARKINAEQAAKDQHNALVHSYRNALPTYLSLNAADRETLNKAAELHRITGTAPTFDGRALVIENTGQKAQWTKPGDRVYLDTPQLLTAAKELHDTLYKAWSDIITGTARKFGWQGEPTSAALEQAAKTELSPSTRRNWNQLSQLLVGLEGQRQSGYMAPLMRFGDYYLAVKPKKPGVAGWDGTGFPPVSEFQLLDAHTPLEKAMGKTEPEGTPSTTAQARIDELRAQYPESDYDIEHGYLFRKADTFRDLNVPAIEKLMTLVGNDVRSQIRAQAKASGDPQAVKDINAKTQEFYDQLISTLRQNMYDELKAGFKKRASVTPGYDPDFQKATGVYLNWAASHVSDLMNRDAIDRADALIQTHPDRQVRSYWDNWDRRNDTPYTALDNGLAKAKQATFLWLLGLNAATTGKIFLHGPMLGVPLLTHGLGLGGRGAAAGSYFRALADVSKTLRWDRDSGLTVDPMAAAKTPEERAMLQRLEEIGVLHPAGADELAAIRRSGAETLDPQAKFSRKVVEIWSSNVRMADRSIRGAMALTAYRLASDPQTRARMVKAWRNDELFLSLGDNPRPEDVARFMVDRSAGVWGEFGRLPMQRGSLAGSALQFRSYEMTYMSNLLNMMTRMGPEGKVTAALMMGSMASLAGVFGLPFAQDALTGAEAIWKLITGIAPDLETRVTEAVNALGVDRVATEAILHGLGRSALGIDLGSGVGFGEALTGHANDPMAVIGPFASLGLGIPSRVMARYRSEQSPAAIISEALPNAVKNAVRGTVVYPQYGIQSATGTQLLPPGELTGTGQVAATLGFQPAEAARARERSEMLYRASEEAKNASALLSKGLGNLVWQESMARSQGDTATADALRNRIDEVLAQASEVGHKTTIQALRRQMLQHLEPEAAASRRVPLAARPHAAENPYVPASP